MFLTHFKDSFSFKLGDVRLGTRHTITDDLHETEIAVTFELAFRILRLADWSIG